MSIGARTVGYVITKMVEYELSLGGGRSTLGVQIETLKQSSEGVFSPRDDSQKNSGVNAIENSLLSRLDLLPLWKTLTKSERLVLVLLNSTMDFQEYHEVIERVAIDPETGAPIVGYIDKDDHVTDAVRDTDGALTGWKVLRLGLRTWDKHTIGRAMSVSEREVGLLNRRGRDKIRRALERKVEMETEALTA